VTASAPREAAGMCLPPRRFRRYTRVLELARQEATTLAAPAVGTAHLVLGLVREDQESDGRLLAGVDPDALRALLPRVRGASTSSALSLRAGVAVGTAQRLADRRGLPEPEAEGLLAAVLADPDCGGVAVLERLGIDVGDLWCRAVAELDREAAPSIALGRGGRVSVRGAG
jgi:ATP-dependent Clp protease ATP-binding subunit ClpA